MKITSSTTIENIPIYYLTFDEIPIGTVFQYNKKHSCSSFESTFVKINTSDCNNVINLKTKQFDTFVKGGHSYSTNDSRSRYYEVTDITINSLKEMVK